MNIKVMQEQPSDYSIVESLIEKSFENAEHTDHSEHRLVARLRKSDEFIPQLSLVAKDEYEIVGHILFTKMYVKNDFNESEALALAPLSVIPKYQGRGIGTILIKEGIKIAKNLGFKSVIVLGHDKYYPRFGFKRASEYNIKAPFPVPDEAFMVLELSENALKDVSGTATYSKAFFE